MIYRQNFGKEGENAAAAYLQQNGYQVLHKNYRYKRAEIDIIAQKEQVLVFAEVKTRSTHRHGYPEEAVSARKEALFLDAAADYIEKTGWLYDIRFDILAVTPAASGFNVYHVEDAFH